jgi:hypothetical protein
MRPRKKAHVAHSSKPTRTPKPRLATTPHACQSQSPAQVLMEARARGDGNAEGLGAVMLDDADVDIDVDVEDMDIDELVDGDVLVD